MQTQRLTVTAFGYVDRQNRGLELEFPVEHLIELVRGFEDMVSTPVLGERIVKIFEEYLRGPLDDRASFPLIVKVDEERLLIARDQRANIARLPRVRVADASDVTRLHGTAVIGINFPLPIPAA